MRAAEEGVLLLCCRLKDTQKPLTHAEYRDLARRMRTAPPQDGRQELTEHFLRTLGYDAAFSARILQLLARGGRLSEYLAAEPRITVLTRVSEGFPERLRRLGEKSPQTLFCLGDTALLRTRCIALVGSRRIAEKNRAFAARIGALCAKEGFTLVSGDAGGADRAAQEACRAAGGSVVCFVPDELCRREAQEGVLYCSTEGYDVPFSAARALERNRFIHALGEKTFVAQCTPDSGGTWQGTTENLRHHYSPVFVFDDKSAGAEALLARGAEPVQRAVRAIDAVQPQQRSLFELP